MFKKLKERTSRLLNNKPKLIGFILSCLAIVAILIYAPISWWLHSGIEMRGVTSIRGSSMNPTINDNDILYVKNVDFERGEIVMVTMPDGNSSMSLLKRIIGLPGETVEITKDGVLINGNLLDEPYTENANESLQESNVHNELILSDNEYFLMGDNRDMSYDSRHAGAFHSRNFLYSLTLEPNEYTYWVMIAWCLIALLDVLLIIVIPLTLFTILTHEKKPQSKSVNNGFAKTKMQSKQRAHRYKNKNKRKNAHKNYGKKRK